MKFLSRSEELILLAVWRLRGNAYVVTIREELKAMTGESWALGALFVTLDRMTRKGYLDSRLSEPTKNRGGRIKRMYRLTREAIESLNAIRELQASLWRDVPVISEEEVA